MLYFTSDLHFGHANIIKYCKRPFADVDTMNEAMINGFNSVVTPHDSVYFLGDITFVKEPGRFLQRMNGTKYLVLGNHDTHYVRDLEPHFVWVRDKFELKTQHPETKERLLITLLHYPMVSWNESHRGSYQLFGHTHGNCPTSNRSMDVGVDTNNFLPYSLPQVCKILDARPYRHYQRENL